MPKKEIKKTENRIAEIENILKQFPRVKAGNPLQAVKWSLSCEKRRLKLKLSKLKGFHITKKQELEFIRKSDGCVICGVKNRLSIDHIIPVDKGGLHCFDNIRVLCINCNSRKKNK
ncbi:HNH endonuclease [Chryseobacterium cucumeris]|uniref:HNH endonuclease n=1 Tax=Chryseobacterium cucumeris TaxID=1813611 RepID=UPI003208AC74